MDQACQGEPGLSELESVKAQLRAEREARCLAEWALESLAGRVTSGSIVGRLVRDRAGKATDLLVSQADSIALAALGVQRWACVGHRLGAVDCPAGEAFVQLVLAQCLSAAAGHTGPRQQFSHSAGRRFAVVPGRPQADEMTVLLIDVTGPEADGGSGRRLPAFAAAEAMAWPDLPSWPDAPPADTPVLAAPWLDELDVTLNAFPEAAFSIDAEGKVLAWNEAAAMAFGWGAAEVLGAPCPFTAAGAEDGPASLAPRVMAGELLRGLAASLRRKDGGTVAVGLSAAPLLGEDGHILGTTFIAMDLTERQRIEGELVRAQAHVDLLASGLHDTFVFRWRQGAPGLDYVSASVENVTGYSAAEIGSDLRLLVERVHPEDRLVLAAALRAVELMRRPVLYRWFRRDGQVIWLEQRLAPVVTEGDKVTVVEGIVTEVTSRIAAQEAMCEPKQTQTELLGLVPMVTYRADFRGRRPRLWVSDNVARVTGFAAEELGNDPLMVPARVHPDDLAEAKRRLGTITRTGWGETDVRWQHADGAYHRYYVRAEAVREAGVTREVRGVVIRIGSGGAALAAGAEAAGSRTVGMPGGWRKVMLRIPDGMAGQPRRPAHCPHCGKSALSRHQTQRRLLDDGRLEVEVVRYRCEDCGRTFTERPGGVTQSSQTEAVRRVSALLYGLGLSLRQVARVLDRAGVHLSPSSIRRNAQGVGATMRQSLHSGVRCVLADDDAPAAGAFMVLARVSLAGVEAKPAGVELLVWSADDELLTWLQRQTSLLGMDMLA
ncbi:MAG: PAS domain S-box protein [Anaerolineae bacterium]